MIPRKGPKVELLGALKLYKEDLEKLVSLFKERCQVVTIGDEESLYSSLDEMQEHAPVRMSFVNGTWWLPWNAVSRVIAYLRDSARSDLNLPPCIAFWASSARMRN